MQWDPALPSEFVERLWDNPNALLTQKILQDKLRCTVARVDQPFGSFTWKRHCWGGAWRTMRRCLSRSTARKSWLDGRFLCQSGVPTPRPRLFLERRVGPFKSRSYLLTDYVPGTSLYRYMRFRGPSRDEIANFARQVAAIWQQLDDVRIQHNDFQTENFLVDPQRKLWLIDLERLCRDERGERAKRKQISDLDRLLHPRNWRANPEAAAIFRQEIVKTAAGTKVLADARSDDHPLKRSLDLANRESQLVTVLVCCRNAAATIVKCLRSVHDMADEILVADAGSTDDTLRLVREFGGCQIVEKTDLNDGEFESCAQSQASHSWVLRINPDEELSAELAREIQYVLATEPAEDAFEVLHNVCFRGQWLQRGGFAGQPSIRLYRKNRKRPGSVGRIQHSITRELCPSIQKYTTAAICIGAGCAHAESITRTEASRHKDLFDAVGQLLRSLVLKSAWLDGWAGVHACWLSALNVYMREAMRRELQHSPERHGFHSSKVCQDLEDFESESETTLPFSATQRTGHLVDTEHRRRRAA
jgi:hypothetical protein